MKNFDWDIFCDKNNKIAVHCKTEEEAIDFCKQMDQHGLTWSSDSSYLRHNYYNTYGPETCYTNNGQFSDLKYFKTLKYRIYDWSDYMQTSPKDILKPGYMVELRSGHYYICLPYIEGYAFVKNFYDPVDLKSYDDKLNYKGNNNFDVMKIYGVANFATDILAFTRRERSLLWERKECQEIKMTVVEMKQKLEEILNAKIVEE